MIQPIFAIGIGITEGQDHLEYARSLFTTYKDRLTSVPESNGFDTTLEDYVGEDTSKAEFAAEVSSTPFGQFILESALEYLQAQGFDTDVHEYKIKNLWLNEMVSGSSHTVHSHSGYNVSGCFYVDVPESSNKISFEGFLNRFDKKLLPTKEYTFFNSDTWTLAMSEGQLGCWNSYLRHFVPEQHFEGVRRSIAFDVAAIRKK